MKLINKEGKVNQGEQIRRWLVAHEDKIDFTEEGFTKRTFKASRAEWEMFYKLLEDK